MSSLARGHSRYAELLSKIRESQALYVPKEKDFAAGVRKGIERIASQSGVEFCKGLLFRPHVGRGDILCCV
jgi:hypothetical protein